MASLKGCPAGCPFFIAPGGGSLYLTSLGYLQSRVGIAFFSVQTTFFCNLNQGWNMGAILDRLKSAAGWN